MKKLYIHKVGREDHDPFYPQYWVEYRVSETEKEPEFLEALFVGEGEYGEQEARDYAAGWTRDVICLWE